MEHDTTLLPSPSGDPVPRILRDWLQALRPSFTAPSWEHALVLVMGAVLAPGKRTVSACLRITGRAQAINFSTYHQLLNRARWDTRSMTRRLLGMIIDRLVPDGRVVIGMDDTIERRWGRRINGRSIYRDPVRQCRFKQTHVILCPGPFQLHARLPAIPADHPPGAVR